MNWAKNHAKTLLLLTNELPQFPFSPLKLKPQPRQQKIYFRADKEKVVADLLVPERSTKKLPAIIIAMGVRQQNKKHLLHFMDSLARLGYAVLWPRMQKLEHGIPLFEQPQTFIQAFLKLKNMQFIDKRRISFFGFSTGASVAFVSATNPKIAKSVKSLVFFGGYYDIKEYLKNLEEKKVGTEKWIPHKLALEESQKIQAATKSFMQKNSLQAINPSASITGFKAGIYILHDKNDGYVPYQHSIKLYKALNDHAKKSLHITDFFNHVHPKKGFSVQMIPSILKLYRFTNEVFKNT